MLRFPPALCRQEEAMEGCQWDSLSYFKVTVCSYMHPDDGCTMGTMSTQLQESCVELS